MVNGRKYMMNGGTRCRMIGVLMALCGCASHVVAQDSLYKKSVNIGLSIYHTGIDSLKLTSLNVGIASGASHLHGVQLNAFSSFALTDAHGIQVSGLSTVASDLRGMQISPFANISLTPFKGIQHFAWCETWIATLWVVECEFFLYAWLANRGLQLCRYT